MAAWVCTRRRYLLLEGSLVKPCLHKNKMKRKNNNKQTKPKKPQHLQIYKNVSNSTRTACQDVKMFLHLLKRRDCNSPANHKSPGRAWADEAQIQTSAQKSIFTFQPSLMFTGSLCAWLESSLGEAPRNCPTWGGEGGVCAAAALCQHTRVQGLCCVPHQDRIYLYHHLPFCTLLRGSSVWDSVNILHLRR